MFFGTTYQSVHGRLLRSTHLLGGLQAQGWHLVGDLRSARYKDGIVFLSIIKRLEFHFRRDWSFH